MTFAPVYRLERSHQARELLTVTEADEPGGPLAGGAADFSAEALV